MQEDTKFSLYYTPLCGYCTMVRRTIARLGIEDQIELRDANQSEHGEALFAARGRHTVPVLRIEEEGKDEWMPESRDIMRYLETRFGDGQPPRGGGGGGGFFDRLQMPVTIGMWLLFGAGLIFSNAQQPLWFAAMALGALRAISRAWATHGLVHVGIAGLFVLGAGAIFARWQLGVDLPWWWAVYLFAGVLFAAGLALRLRARREQSPA